MFLRGVKIGLFRTIVVGIPEQYCENLISNFNSNFQEEVEACREGIRSTGSDNERLVRRLRPDEIAVIAHRDLDELAAKASEPG